MTPKEALLCAVCDNPEDDAPRLMYADFLEEQGEPLGAARAEFIRVMCALEQLPLPQRPRSALAVRYEQLREAHGEAWRAELPALPGIRWRGFGRGFVEWADATSPKAYLEQADLLFRAAPVRELGFHRLTPRTLQAVAGSPWLVRLTSLYLTHNRVGDAGTAALASSLHLGRLRELDLSGVGMTDAGAQALASAPVLAGLKRLNLSLNRIGDAGAHALADSPHLRGLALLDLRWNSVLTSRGALRGRFGDRVLL